MVPFDRRDDARDEVEWEGPFLTAEGEGDPSLGKGPAKLLEARLQFVGVEVEQRLDYFLIDRTRNAGLGENLIPGPGWIKLNEGRTDFTFISLSCFG
jgi:hypothetical protein